MCNVVFVYDRQCDNKPAGFLPEAFLPGEKLVLGQETNHPFHGTTIKAYNNLGFIFRLLSSRLPVGAKHSLRTTGNWDCTFIEKLRPYVEIFVLFSGPRAGFDRQVFDYHSGWTRGPSLRWASWCWESVQVRSSCSKSTRGLPRVFLRGST